MITATVIATAAKAAEAGQEKEISFLDDGREGVAGLCIRVKGNGAHWYIRIKGHKASIAELSAFKADDLPRLRELSTTIKGAWKAGRSQAAVKLIISEFLRQPKTVRSAKVAENEAAVVINGAWTWRVLRDKYLEYAREAKSE